MYWSTNDITCWINNSEGRVIQQKKLIQGTLEAVLYFIQSVGDADGYTKNVWVNTLCIFFLLEYYNMNSDHQGDTQSWSLFPLRSS